MLSSGGNTSFNSNGNFLESPSFVDPMLLMKVLSKKCTLHPSEPCDLIYLSVDTFQHRLCNICAKDQNIPQSKLLNISQVFSTSTEIQPGNFPILEDSETANRVKSAQDKFLAARKDVKQFSLDLMSQVEKALKTIEETNSKIENLAKAYKNTIDAFNQAASIETLKGILLTSNEDQEQALGNFIKHSFNSSKTNTDLIQANCQKFEEINGKFCVPQTKLIQEAIDGFLKQIDFFSSKLIPQISQRSPFTSPLLRSLSALSMESLAIDPSQNFGNSARNTLIEKENTGSIIITNIGMTNGLSQFYFRNKLSNSTKYIVRLQLLHNKQNNSPYFAFGLMPGNTKDDQYLGDQYIYYHEIYDRQMNKIIHGKELHSGHANIGTTKQLEFRIDLARKFFRAADYPEYRNVVELDKTDRIEDSKNYYFTLYIGNTPDSVRILEACSVEEFDNKMD